ncbi:transglutaminase-like domain-containing protein [Agromyces sp. G08B096]|uniref:Transglutaminase-like domain-containing protein n=1 Tax=Agromyces sp. G08B096 TaxID=3156399 RepID=A0AAU7W7X2_9MICO
MNSDRRLPRRDRSARSKRAAALAARRERDRPQELVGLGYLVVGTVIAVLAAWPVHETLRLLLVAAAGLVVGVGAAVLARRLARGGVARAALAAGLALAGYVVIVVPVSIPSALRSVPDAVRGLRDGIVGIVVGWKQLLTLDLPLGEYQAVLVPFTVVVVAGATAAAMLVLRGGRSAPWAVLPVLAMSAFGLAFGASSTSAPIMVAGVELSAPRELGVGLASVAAAVGWLLIRHRMLRARALARARAGTVRTSAGSGLPALRRRALAATILVVAFVGGVAVAPAAASLGERQALRDQVEPSVVVQRQPSPLAAYRSWLAADRFDEVAVRLDGDVHELSRLPFATLDAYDGEVFHVDPDARFARLPRNPPVGAELVEVEVEVGDAYGGVWVPAPAGLAAAPRFSGARAEELADGFHRASGGEVVDIAPVEGVTDASGAVGLAPGDRYTVVAERPDATEQELRDRLAGATGDARTLDPELYPQLTAWAEEQEQPRTGAGLIELVERLRARGYLSHALVEDASTESWMAALAAEAGGYAFLPSYAGHSRSRIETLFESLLDQQRRAGEGAPDSLLVAGVGDDEQFAVAAALLARHLGFDSRVALGVRLPGAEAVPGEPGCEGDCTGASMAAWVEVRASGGDWTPLDVTPQFAQLPTEIAEGEQLPHHPTVPDDARSEPLDPERAQNDADASATSPADDETATSAWVWQLVRTIGLWAALVVFLALPFVAVLVAKAVRRAGRRRAPDPELRVLGAWDEVADAYADAGRPMAEAASRRTAAQRTGRPALVRLAASVDEAVFSPFPPTEEQADEAWRLADGERAELRAAARPRERIRMALSLRSFTGRVRSTTTARRAVHQKEITP